jgi:hypothetical protein
MGTRVTTVLIENGELAGTYVDSQSRTHGFFWGEGKFTTLDPPKSVRTQATSKRCDTLFL